MDYEPWQLDRIRQGVKAFQLLGVQSGHNYTWPEVEAEILAETGQVVPHGRLSKFVIGEPHRNREKKALGIRHYPPPTSDRLTAIIEFLTDPESTGYVFHKGDLDIYAPKTQGPLRLMEYLSSNPDNIEKTHYISPKNLSGVFATKYRKAENILASSVRFGQATHDSLIEFVLIEYNDDTLRFPEVFEEEIEQLKKLDIVVNRYRGFAVITPEENLMLFGKLESNNDNLVYLSVGIDGAIYQENIPIAALVLLKHGIPVDHVDVNTEEDNGKMFLAVVEELSSQLYLFQRAKDEHPDHGEPDSGEED